MNPESNLVRQQEITQIRWGIQVFAKFLMFAAKRNALDKDQISKSLAELENLAKSIDDNSAPELIGEQLNKFISEINTSIKQKTDLHHYTPFPSFSFATAPHIESSVLDHLDMLERLLSEGAESGTINWEKESVYFADLLQIFTSVEERKITPQEGMARLSGEIIKINQDLPDEWKLPIPELSAYE